MQQVNTPKQLLVARQVKAEILLQPEYVADQRCASFLFVGAIGHPEQQGNTADKKDKGQARKYPKPAPAADAFREG